MSASHHINGDWIEGSGTPFFATDPTTGEASWNGRAATADEVERAVSAARVAQELWGSISVDERAAYLHRFGEQLKLPRAAMIDAICRSTGKPPWEAGTEVDAMVGKIGNSLDAQRERRSASEKPLAGATAATRYKPHGVVAVFGPFNFPGHLPNGHIMPALLAGNAVIFKPSEQAPLVGQMMMQLWIDAGLPRGVMNLLQGGRDTGALLAA